MWVLLACQPLPATWAHMAEMAILAIVRVFLLVLGLADAGFCPCWTPFPGLKPVKSRLAQEAKPSHPGPRKSRNTLQKDAHQA